MTLTFESNPVLFGHGHRAGLLAADLTDGRHVRLYTRQGTEEVPFSPYLWVTSESLLSGVKVPCRVEPLEGSAAYRFLVFFESWADLGAARKVIMKASRQSSEGSDTHLFINDPVQQFLTLTGETLFRGMRYGDLVRMQIDVQTFCGPGTEWSADLTDEERPVAIGVRTTRGTFKVLAGTERTEAELLRQLGQLIVDEDPDVIEGHDLSRTHLPYLRDRARKLGVSLHWGRDGSAAEFRASRINFAEKTVDYLRCDVAGRHVVDTWLLLQLYDISSRDLDGYTLADAGRYFGTLPDDSALDENVRLSWTRDNALERIEQWAGTAATQAGLIAELLSPSYFLQAQMLPYSYQNAVVRGNATKINALFLREYLRQRHTIPPVPDDYNTYEGGLTAIFEEGVVRNVVHCDVASLYPSLMQVYHLAPRNDELGVFLPLLSDLKKFRLEAKQLAISAPSPEDRHHYTALQQTFKIFINSFYGYLGTSFSNFADTTMAAEVTQKGRDLINHVIDELRGAGCRPIEIDTDGVYFVPPDGVDGSTVVEAISKALPVGINLETDAVYPAMFSHKTKNYALLQPDGTVLIKGSGLKSRGIEKYLRDLTHDVIKLLLEGRTSELTALYETVMEQVASRQMDIRLLAKTETLSETLESYRQKVTAKKRNAAAPYELALQSGRKYKPGDQITYYVAGDAKKVRLFDSCRMAREWNPTGRDENVAYYQQKARETFERFLPYVPPDSPLHGLLAKKPAKGRQAAEGQQAFL